MVKTFFIVLFIAFISTGYSQIETYELNTDWKCRKFGSVDANGETISKQEYNIIGWEPATVPGTILTTLLNNGEIPDPFYGMNNEKIPDIYFTGRGEYTYWFIKDFDEKKPKNNNQVWLKLRGVNYSCEVYLNGKKLNKKTHYGMFLRQEYNISGLLNNDGKNRLAVLVFPPDPVGEPNGGQGGDGTIAKNVSHQYVAGWDWIQPMRDRNTGIWDKVEIEKTGLVKLRNPHLKTVVPGVRFPGKNQEPAKILSTIEVENTSSKTVDGELILKVAGTFVSKNISLKPKSISKVDLPNLNVNEPKLWWPNGYGDQNLYNAVFSFKDIKGKLIDSESHSVGIREIQTEWNPHTQSMQIGVNGQKIFIKGGNWIISDAMLRFSKERYDSEIRFHRDMNLNLIRIWGGALTERPEFYEACDKYGLLVMQDFWISADCNGKWMDPKKKEDQFTRRKYPDDHKLFIQSAADQVKMIRNHPSLAMWCGGNEIAPPADILQAIQDSILPNLDGSRYFFPYSNSDEMSYNTIGGNGDGPYTIQNKNIFWEERTFPFNSEVGSVGTGDFESLERFIPSENMVVPDYERNIVDSVWVYHKDIGYENYINNYGKPTDVKDFGEKAQLVNYNQYRALAEGLGAQMWLWYTGYMIWKTQNPWTSLRGQMYDYYLDPNACLYGLKNGAEPIHVMCNPTDGMISVANNTFVTRRDMMLEVKLISIDGEEKPITSLIVEVGASLVQKFFSVQRSLDKEFKSEGGFLSLKLNDLEGKEISENLYWFPDSTGNYSGLQRMPESKLEVKILKAANGKIEINLSNPENAPVAFFNRLSIINKNSGKRELPCFYSDNYVSVLAGETKKIYIDYTKIGTDIQDLKLSVRGMNFNEKHFEIK
jgi:hypothetical protein